MNDDAGLYTLVMGDLKYAQDAFDAASDFLSPVLNRGKPLSTICIFISKC
jgi:hypothetical protein